MRRFIIVIMSLMALSICSLSGCSKDEEVEAPDVNNSNTIQFSANAGERIYDLQIQGKSILNPNEVDWCTPSLKEHNLIFDLKNNNTSTVRKVIYRIETSSGIISISIIQEPEAIIEMKSTVPSSISTKGENIKLSINSNIKYNVIFKPENQDWLTLKSVTKTNLELICSPNTDSQSRSVEVILVDCENNILYTFTIFQQGNQPKNVIIYTSTDGGKVIPSNSINAFGGGFSIISNTYFNNEGVITFDGDINGLNQAFTNCTNLKTIYLPEGIKNIGNSTFSGCINLKEINIPYEVTSIGDDAFYKCTNLSTIILPENVTSIGNGAFSRSGIIAVNLPKNLLTLGNFAFEECKELENVNINNNLKSIGSQCFRNCTKISKLYFPISTLDFGNYCFRGLTADISLYLKSNTNFSSEAFYEFSGSLTIPNDNPKEIPTDFGYYISKSKSFKGFYGKFASDDHKCLIINEVLYACNLNEDYTENTYNLPSGIKKISSYAISFAPDYKGNNNLVVAKPLHFVFQEGLEIVECPAIFHEQNFAGVTRSITFPQSLQRIESNKQKALSYIGYLKIFFHSTTPPELFNFWGWYNGFDYNSDVMIYVPKGCSELYKKEWSKYASIIRE